MQNHILDYLTEIVKKKPDKLAFADDQEELTFRQVWDYSRSIGTFLHQEGILHQPVVVFMRKHPKEIAAFFGVITGGDFYVPIDEEMPAGRIRLILENVQPRVIICDEETYGKAKTFVPAGQQQPAEVPESGSAAALSESGMDARMPEPGGDAALQQPCRIVLFDEICQTPGEEAALQEIYDHTIDTDPIYIVFTSGSTGVPKGVAACHRSVIDYIEQLSEVLGFDEGTVFGNQTPLYFDACLKELYPTLKFGATTYLIPRDCFLFPVKLVEYLNEHRINTICWVVSALTMISAFGTFRTIRPQYLRTVAFGSEVFPIKQFKRWREALPGARFINLYGPTEGTGMCCYYEVNREFAPDEVIPIGRPFKNTDIILLKEDGTRAGEGEEGEICIRGTSLTLGYYHNFEKTREVFVQNPLNTAYPELIYRTGDMGRHNEYGELVFVSRKDYQIKHMGHRIELGEIEVNVNMLDGVKIAGCVYDTAKGKIVLCYVGSLEEKEMAEVLKEKLPRYMFPNRIVRLEQMPFTANGKIDRVTLGQRYAAKG